MPFAPVVANDDSWSYTPLSAFGEALISNMSAWVTTAPTPALAWYLDAAASTMAAVYDLVSDVGFDGEPGYTPGYDRVMNPLTADPVNYPWIGNFVGVSIDPGTDPNDALSILLAEAGQKRGTPASIIAAAQRTLTGSQHVSLIERTYITGAADGYWFLLQVIPTECPNPAATIAAVESVRPGGTFWTLVQATWIISQMEAAYGTITALEAAFASVSTLEADVTH